MRRFAALLATLVLVAAPALAQKPPQQAPQPPQRQQQAGPQEGIAAPRGWRREVAATGTIYFHCAGASTCREGDVVSYVVQPPGRTFTIDVFRERQERVNRRLQSERGFRNVEMAAPRDESRGNTIVYVAELDLTDSRGNDLAWISVYIARDQRHATLISTAPTLSAARDNIAGFQTALIAWLGGRPR